MLVILCGAGAWVRSNRWQRAKRERPDLEDPLSVQPLTSRRGDQPRESLRAPVGRRSPSIEMTSHSAHHSRQLSRESLASQGAPMGTEIREQNSGSLQGSQSPARVI